ncbi:CP4FN-like protein [Mya arenaria]|uniref:CP4FN-like protein n=1 Tax=Mya arenaria TaxID=6604 RepID=A0ABY7EFF5_MYAAR|nr:CP4FN-like protein [Mya arenaria]
MLYMGDDFNWDCSVNCVCGCQILPSRTEGGGEFPKDPTGRILHFIKICNEYEEDGIVFLWGFFRRPIVIACTPESMARISKSNAPKSRGLMGVYRMIEPWLGEGLLVANGQKWARNRRLLTPAFHFDILKPYTNVFNASADVLVAKLKSKAASNDRFDVFQNVDTNPYVKAVNRITDSLFHRFLYPYMLFDFIFYNTSVGRQFKKDCNFVHSVAEEIIHKRKKALDGGENVALEGKRYVDFLDILLTARDEEGVGLSSLEVMIRRRRRSHGFCTRWRSIRSTRGSVNRKLIKCCKEETPTLSDMPKFEFLTQCIKEGMRLHAPVPIVNREVKEDFEIGGRNIPAGSIVQLNIWALHHKESVWGPDHMEFKPERFSPENVDKMSPFQFVPFSAGPRNCIGQHFAMNEEKSVLAKLLRNFTFRLDTSHEVKKNPSAVMRTVDGMFMYVEERNA